MSNDVYSNAFNFKSFQDGKVDSRTGQYSAVVHLVTLRPEGAVEAQRDINLTFATTKSTSDGYGIGWSLSMTEFDPESRYFKLATGERYLANPLPPVGYALTFQDKKLKNVEVKNTDSSTLTVYHLDGTTETLRRPSASSPFKTMALTFENGERFVYEYTPQGQLTRIASSVTGTEFLSLTYANGAISRARFIASGGRKAEVAFTIVNGLVTAITVPYDNTSGTANPSDQAKFVYQYQSFSGGMHGIVRVDNPMGGSDWISYQANGHQYYQGTYLPFVTKWQRVPGAGQPPVVRSYRYSAGTNFTGYPFSGGFTAGTDNLYKIVGTYDYWCEETVIDTGNANAVIEGTTTTFNKFHLMTSEVKRRGTATTTTTILYNEIPGQMFSGQPANLQLAREHTTTYQATGSAATRAERTIIETDAYGNVVAKTEPTGIRTERSYYPTAGVAGECPAEPSGLFVRYCKQETVVPAQDDVASRQTSFKHLQLPRIDGGGYFVLRATDTVSNGSETTCSYVNDPSRPTLHGRLQTLVTRLNGCATTTASSFEIAGHEVTETRTITGYDGTQSDALRRFDLPTALLLEVRKAGGAAIRFDHDVLGRLTSETVAPGTSSEAVCSYAYDHATTAGGTTALAKLRVTDAGGNRYVSRFDGLGRTVSSAEVTGESTERRIRATAYDCDERKISDTEYDLVDGEELTLVTGYRYNDWNEVSHTTRPDGSVALSVRDHVLDTMTTGTEGLNTTITTYNAFQQVAGVTQVDRSGAKLVTLTRAYDGFGRCTSVTDVDGHVTTFEYDAFDRIVRSDARPADATPARSITAGYAAFTSDALKASVAVNGTALGTRMFDGVGRLQREAKAGLLATTFAYQGSATKPSEKLSPRNLRLGYAYDPALDALTGVDVQQSSTNQYQYDRVTGQVLLSSNATATRSYTYDTHQYPATETLTIDGTDSVARYTHSPGGRLVRFESPMADVETRGYDAAGRLLTIVNGACTLQNEYDAYGRVAATVATQSGVALRTALTFDGFGREESRSFQVNNEVLQSIHREYHPNGNLARRLTRDGGGATVSDETFAYDAYSRLTRYACTGSRFPADSQGREVAQQTFSYDGLDNITQAVTEFCDGNRNTSTRTYNPSVPGQLVEITDTAPAAHHTLQYDAAGNLIDDGHGQTFQYDEFDRLSFSSRAGSYGYDADGKLVVQSVSGASPLTLHHGSGRIVGETQGSASIRYHRDDDKVRGRRLQPDGGTASDELNALDTSGSVVGSLADSATGCMYTPYGESGPMAVAEDTPLIERHRIAFNGERLDAMANLYHLGNGRRAYSPQLMMFLSPDPMAPFDGAGYSGYGYCKGDPINAVDPTGLLSNAASVALSTIGLFLAIIMFGIALIAAIPTGGASLSILAVVGAVGAGLGVVSSTLGVASSGVALADENNGWDRSAVSSALNIASLAFGAAAMLTSAFTGVWQGVSTFRKVGGATFGATARYTSREMAVTASGIPTSLGHADEVVHFSTAMSTAARAGRGAWAGAKTFFGLSKNALINLAAVGNFAVGTGLTVLGAMAINPSNGSNGNGQGEVPPSSGSDDRQGGPEQAYRPAIDSYADSLASQRKYNEEFQRQVARIRGSFSNELYRGVA